MFDATCIGCGCDDSHACWDAAVGEACSWLRVERMAGVGVCSSCPEHTDRWDEGDMTEATAPSTEDLPASPSMAPATPPVGAS